MAQVYTAAPFAPHVLAELAITWPALFTENAGANEELVQHTPPEPTSCILLQAIVPVLLTERAALGNELFAISDGVCGDALAARAWVGPRHSAPLQTHYRYAV